MRTDNSRGKRRITLILTIIMVLGLLSTSVIAADTSTSFGSETYLTTGRKSAESDDWWDYSGNFPGDDWWDYSGNFPGNVITAPEGFSTSPNNYLPPVDWNGKIGIPEEWANMTATEYLKNAFGFSDRQYFDKIDSTDNANIKQSIFDAKNDTELEDPTRVIVDSISPTATITYNNYVQTNGSIYYCDGNIEVTIVIKEANLDSGDVIITVTKDGIDYPVSVSWENKGVDIHTGSFLLDGDGNYIVSVQYNDKSESLVTAYTSNKLALDTTAPTIKVSNIKNNSTNIDAEYGFEIEVSDMNPDTTSIKPVLQVVKQTPEGDYQVAEVDLGSATTAMNGQIYTYTVENLPDDGIYTLICKVEDMSANSTSQIVLEDGQSYDQVQFSINRNGSAFGYGNAFTEKLINQYYGNIVDNDVVVVEVNVDPIESYKVTLNGKELVEGTDYTTVQTSNNGEWSKRTYTISKELFTAEGEYSIIVTSTDKANTTAFSDVKNLSLSFVVDQTKPVLTITGLEAGGRYQTDAQTVTLIPTDEGGRLNSLSVVVLDSDGNPLKNKETGEDISARFEMSGEELLKYLEENDGKVIFTIPEGLNNKVQIICNDCAVNAENLTNEYNELFENVTVSQNQLVIFYANKPAFYGTIGGTVAAGVLLVFLLKRKKIFKVKK